MGIGFVFVLLNVLFTFSVVGEEICETPFQCSLNCIHECKDVKVENTNMRKENDFLKSRVSSLEQEVIEMKRDAEQSFLAVKEVLKNWTFAVAELKNEIELLNKSCYRKDDDIEIGELQVENIIISDSISFPETSIRSSGNKLVTGDILTGGEIKSTDRPGGSSFVMKHFHFNTDAGVRGEYNLLYSCHDRYHDGFVNLEAFVTNGYRSGVAGGFKRYNLFAYRNDDYDIHLSETVNHIHNDESYNAYLEVFDTAYVRVIVPARSTAFHTAITFIGHVGPRVEWLQ